MELEETSSISGSGSKANHELRPERAYFGGSVGSSGVSSSGVRCHSFPA